MNDGDNYRYDDCSYKIQPNAGNSAHIQIPMFGSSTSKHGENFESMQTISRKDLRKYDKIKVMTKKNKKPNWLNKIPTNIGWYITGFVDGEGSFSISIRQRSDFSRKWQPTLSFNVSQRDLSNLKLMQKYLMCGRLQDRKDGVHYFVVLNPGDLLYKVIPFFEKFVFLSEAKLENFKIFKKAVKIMVNGGHLTKNGLLEIIKLREQINKGRGRKRKYELKHYLKSQESSETIRWTPILSVKM